MSAPERAGFFARLRIYQRERFPVLLNGVMTLALCAGSIAAFRHDAGFSLVGILPAFLAVFPIFFVMRVADEHKDLAEDRLYRPERPVPRGLVSLGELRVAGLIALALPVGLALFLAPAALVPLLLALVWVGAMSAEFGVPRWLKAHPLVYLVSHMLVMPLLALLAVSFTVRDPSTLMVPSLIPILGLAFLAGTTLEVGRKVWGAEKERDGVETYSKLWGPDGAAIAFGASATGALVVAVVAGGAHPIAIGFALVIIAGVWGAVLAYRAGPTGPRAALIQLAAGLSVILSYALCLIGARLV